MRTFLLVLLLWFGCLDVMSQDADWNDYRRKNESFSRIYDKSMKSDLASFTIGGIEESLGQTPLRRVPVVQFGGDYIAFDSNHIRVIIHSAPFISSKHKLTYEAKHLVKIDNKPYYGNYGRMPGTVISSVLVILDKDTVIFPPGAFSDLYNPGFTYTDASGNVASQDAVYLSADKRTMYVYMLNRDDTGSYEITWVIQDRKYLRRVLDYGFSK